jgi:hypothetical protein
MDNAARQTANKIVDTLVSNNQNKVEDAFVTLSNKLYTDVWSAEPTDQGRTNFIKDVFQNINEQYLDGKTAPAELSLVWANQQLGHELPKEGFNKEDLQAVENSNDPKVTVLDKFFANELVKDYDDLQVQAKNGAINRYYSADYCKSIKETYAKYPDVPHAPIVCTDTVDPADMPRFNGVIRTILPLDLQTRINAIDGKNRPLL